VYPARAVRLAVTVALTGVFAFLTILQALRGHLMLVVIYLAFAVISGFRVWLLVTRNQPVPHSAAVIHMLMGKKALPPKNE
jgi:hypothetical protein